MDASDRLPCPWTRRGMISHCQGRDACCCDCRLKGTGRRKQNLLAFPSIAVNLSVPFEEPAFVNVALSFVSCCFWKLHAGRFWVFELASGPGQSSWDGLWVG
ncbi:hypothetical protein KY290_008310 [Solanum tuberosum]|uniref:Uncharacterized protein n=1 Tax=Solanum tuberosum TaxID=4113 RepID=A0ABQ7W809_SOLTU|nr:hypothetical protein KY290_008310 [Solanum tuberosum]